jgi:regulatory protein
MVPAKTPQNMVIKVTTAYMRLNLEERSCWAKYQGMLSIEIPCANPEIPFAINNKTRACLFFKTKKIIMSQYNFQDGEPKKKKKQYSYSEVKTKAMAYCSYQERTQQQVRDKLYDYGLHYDEVEELITFLITENFLNEERFAKSYAGGKFRMKGWGRNKILQGMKQHRLSPYCIKAGMAEIDPEDYYNKLVSLAEKKSEAVRELDPFKKKQSLANYLIRKGYESDLVWDVIKELKSF